VISEIFSCYVDIRKMYVCIVKKRRGCSAERVRQQAF